MALLLAGLVPCLRASGQGVDSLAALEQGPGAQVLPLPASLGDTALYVQARNSRIGFNSLVFANTVLGRYRAGRLTQWAEAGQTFLYNLRLNGNGGRFVQQDYFARGEQLYALSPAWQIGHRAGAYAFKAIGNSFARYEGLARWKPTFRRLDLFSEATAGVVTDKRGDIQNTGPSISARTWGTALSRDSLTQYSWSGQLAQAYITPRQMSLLSAKAGVSQQVGRFATTRATAGYLRRRVEDYLAGQIQQIISDSLEATLFLASQIGPRVQFQSDNRVLLPARQFNYRGGSSDSGQAHLQNSRFNQSEIYTRQALTTEGKRLLQTFSLELTQLNRSYGLDNNLGLDSRAFDRAVTSERVKNITEQTVAYGYTGNLRLSRRSSLRGTWTGSLLRVNTPSELNDQDRDETFYTSELFWQHRWLRALRTGLRLSGAMREVVFIKGTQSAQNYTERVLRLEPSVNYALGPVKLTGSFGVWATYNVRDFAQEQAKNRANRIWIQTYQVRYQAPQRLYTVLDLVRRENRIAQLNWEKFTESPIDTVVITDLHGRIGKMLALKSTKSDLSIEVGYKLYRQDRHYLAGVTMLGMPTRQAALHTITLQHGPTAALAWELPGRGRIVLDGWVQRASTHNLYKLSDELFVGQTYASTDLDRVDVHWYLFFNLTGQIVLR